MRLIAFTFLNRWNPCWVKDPTCFNEILVPNSGPVEHLPLYEEADSVILSHVLSNNGNAVRDFVLVPNIKVEQKINKRVSMWYLRAVPLDQNQDITDDYLICLQNKIRDYRRSAADNGDAEPFAYPYSETNDLKNLVWLDLDSGVFLTYNKNACARLIRHYPKLARRHVMDHIDNASESVQCTYEESVYAH